MFAKEILLTQFDYNTWANQRIFDQATNLQEDQLLQPSIVGDRSLHQILAHLVRVEKLWRLLATKGYADQKPRRNRTNLSK